MILLGMEVRVFLHTKFTLYHDYSLYMFHVNYLSLVSELIKELDLGLGFWLCRLAFLLILLMLLRLTLNLMDLAMQSICY